MRVLPNTYYRIELPGDTKEDLEQADLLKKTLATVLYYERTACPFQRGFGLDLPEMPKRNSRRLSRELVEPAKRWKLDKIWRPEGHDPDIAQPSHPDTHTGRYDTATSSEAENDITTSDPAKSEADEEPVAALATRRDKPRPLSGLYPAKKLAAMRSVTAPPQLTCRANKVRDMADRFNHSARDTSPPVSRPCSSRRLPPTPESIDDYEHSHMEDLDIPAEPSTMTETSGLPEARPVTEMPHIESLMIVEQPCKELEPSLPRESPDDHQAEDSVIELPLPKETQKQAISGATETEEESTPVLSTVKPPSPPKPVEEQIPVQTPAISSTTSTAGTTFSGSSPALSTASLSSTASWSSLPVLTPSEATNLLRQRRHQSPSSSSSIRSSSSSSSSSPPTQTQLIRTTPARLVRKTCAIFLGPPANLVATMLRIAARLVASGALNQTEPTFHDMFSNNTAAAVAATAAGRLRGHRRVPGSWDLSDDDEDWGF
jgi:hypothetical protein